MICCPWKNHTTRSRPYEFPPIEKRQYLLAFQNHTIFPLFKNRTISVPLKNPTNGRLFLAWWTTMRFVTLSKPYRFLTVGKQHDSWPAGNHWIWNTFAISTYISILTCTNSPCGIAQTVRLYTGFQIPYSCHFSGYKPSPKANIYTPTNMSVTEKLPPSERFIIWGFEWAMKGFGEDREEQYISTLSIVYILWRRPLVAPLCHATRR